MALIEIANVRHVYGESSMLWWVCREKDTRWRYVAVKVGIERVDKTRNRGLSSHIICQQATGR